MVPPNLKLNQYVYTRIPRPAELFRRSGYKQVIAQAMYSGDDIVPNESKVDSCARVLDDVMNSED